MHDNLCDFKVQGSIKTRYRLRVKQKLASQFQFSIKGLKFESQVNLIGFLGISLKAYTLKLIGKRISSSLRPLIIPLISRNQKLTYQNNRSVKKNQLHCKMYRFFFTFFNSN